jgi:hypothetical protein
MATTAGAPPGSGANFAALKGKLAGRGVRNPGALAAYIGRRKYGRKGFSKLGQMGRSHGHSNDGLGGILMASTDMTCPNCGYSGDNAEFKTSDSGDSSASGTSLGKSPGALQTPANTGLQSSAGFGAGSAGLGVRGAGSGNMGLANQQPAVELSRRMAVTVPWDLHISRGEGGVAIVRHRRGGQEIGQLRRDNVGRWVPSIDGRDLAPKVQQRAALMHLVSLNNTAAGTPFHRPAGEPLQPAPTQTPLMAAYGIPAVRALAMPATSSAGGPRVVTSGLANGDSSDGDSDDDDTGNGLNAKGQGIYKKLIARGFPAARALAFAKRAQNMGAGK